MTCVYVLDRKMFGRRVSAIIKFDLEFKVG